VRVAAIYDIHGNLPALEGVLDEIHEAAADRIRAIGYPPAEEFAAVNVLKPPTEAAMLEAFSRVELS